MHNGFSTILAAGFVGGHGTAAAIGSAFAELGWRDAQSLAMTSATVGILAAISGGIIWINWHQRSEVEGGSKQRGERTAPLNREVIPDPDFDQTAASSVMDPLAFQLSLVLITFLGGYYLHQLWSAYVPDFKLPLFCPTVA